MQWYYWSLLPRNWSEMQPLLFVQYSNNCPSSSSSMILIEDFTVKWKDYFDCIGLHSYHPQLNLYYYCILIQTTVTFKCVSKLSSSSFFTQCILNLQCYRVKTQVKESWADVNIIIYAEIQLDKFSLVMKKEKEKKKYCISWLLYSEKCVYWF